MPARDIFHDVVKVALQKEGWTITHDPFTVDLADGQLQIDLGAERLIAAQRNKEEIAIEVKSFVAPSAISEFHVALGQYLNYRVALKVKQPDRKLYLGVSLEIYESFFGRQLPQLSLKEYQIKVVVFDPEDEVIVQWIT